MTVLRNVLTRAGSPLHNPAVPLTSASLIDWLSGSKTTTGIAVDEDKAVRKMIAVYRAVTLVSGAIGALPLRAYLDTPARTPIDAPILREPNPDNPPMEVWEAGLAQMLLWGNAYYGKNRNGVNRVVSIDPIPPQRIQEIRRVARTGDNPQGKEFDVLLDSGRTVTKTPFDILHIPGPSYDGVAGLSPIGVARQAIGLGLAAEEYGARLFGSGSLMSGFLHTEAGLSEPHAKALKTRWQDMVGGLDKAHQVAILDRGLKWQSISIPPQDAQFIQSREFQIEEVGRLYGIPPHLIGQSDKQTSWGTGVEQMSIGFVVYTLTPWMTRFEQRIAKELLPTGVLADFQTEMLLRGDIKSRYEAYDLAVTSGWMKPSEPRLRENYPPEPALDHYRIRNNVSILGDDGQPIPNPNGKQRAATRQGVPT